jgi:chemotaxis-related protein WspB
MLMLLFSIGDDLYALESSRLIEIIPRVPLRKIHHVPEYVAGLFNYRGSIVPVIDLCHLISGLPSRTYLSTRIMMVQPPQSGKSPQYLGLIAERITKTINKPENAIIESSLQIQKAPYLGGIIMEESRIIQRIHLEKLFTEVQTTYLLMAGEDELNRD